MFVELGEEILEGRERVLSCWICARDGRYEVIEEGWRWRRVNGRVRGRCVGGDVALCRTPVKGWVRK